MKHIGVLNIMPATAVKKTEKQWKQSISTIEPDADITFFTFSNRDVLSPGDTQKQALRSTYIPFHEIRDKYFDRVIITGAGIEFVPYSEITFWNELQDIFGWSEKHVASTIFSCWSSHAALKYFYGIDKQLPLIPKKDNKIFGLFDHIISKPNHLLTDGLGSYLTIPHSRYGNINPKDLNETDIEILIQARDAKVGFLLASSKDTKKVFLQGHPEYDARDLHDEYIRDAGKTAKPQNYYQSKGSIPDKTWGIIMHTLMKNWLSASL